MSKQAEALKLALEALEDISGHYMSLPKKGCMALAAIEEALAEQPAQQQEPVAWVVEDNDGERLEWAGDVHSVGGLPTFPLYTSPQIKPWFGLTDEEAEDIWNRYCDEMGEASINDALDIAQAIESALRSKNT